MAFHFADVVVDRLCFIARAVAIRPTLALLARLSKDRHRFQPSVRSFPKISELLKFLLCAVVLSQVANGTPVR